MKRRQVSLTRRGKSCCNTKGISYFYAIEIIACEFGSRFNYWTCFSFYNSQRQRRKPEFRKESLEVKVHYLIGDVY